MRLASLLVLAPLSACGHPAAHPAPQAVHWSYQAETGPEHWAELSPGFSPCAAGHQQSPIDLGGARPGASPGYDLHYAEAPAALRNNGHTIQVDVPPGSWISVGGHRFDLLQYHFHAPGEHRLGGRSFPLELHLVHRDSAGALAVIGVLIEEGEGNPGYAMLAERLPASAGEHADLPGPLNPRALLPQGERLRAYRYAGSLTTPPCSEGVRWHVLDTPVALSAGQIERFRAALHGNARPVQALHGRVVEVDGP